jgi:hypothetical protein
MKNKTIKRSQLPTTSANISLAKSAIIRESINASSSQTFDVFLSHSFIDNELILRFRELLTNQGKSVYVDWLVDKVGENETIDKTNALKIQSRMKQCETMIYVHTPSASISKWCPWEVGYFDALNKKVLVSIISDSDEPTTGQEYLDIYDRFFIDGTTYSPVFRRESDSHYHNVYL